MQTLSIGRDATNHIVLNDSKVSRHHAQLTIMDDGMVMLKDLGSVNGSFVNGNKITETYLKPGDVVKCSGAFLNWSQFITPVMVNPNFQQQPAIQNYGQFASDIDNGRQFSLGETIKYLATKILDTGDLFKTDWDKTQSILFFVISPLVIVFGLLIYVYSKFQVSFWYNVVIPLFTSFLIFGVSQAVTLSLLSINRNLKLTKILLAAAIYSFLQFCIYGLLTLSIANGFFNGFNFNLGIYINNYGNHQSYFAAYFFLGVLVVSLLLSMSISLLIFINKYFRSIGVPRGISIHFTIISFTLNLLIQVALAYLSIAIIGSNIFHF